MRQIIFSKEFDLAVGTLGGYRLVDTALEAIIDGLRLNPYSFPKFENDWISFRYAVTQAFGNVPALVVCFRITEDNDVELTHAEAYENY